MSIASSFVAAFQQDTDYFKRVDGIKEKADYLKAGPVEITSGVQNFNLLRQRQVMNNGIGAMLQEKQNQEDQVRANAANNTGSPYLATGWVNSYLQQSNYQNLIAQQRAGGRALSRRYLSIPLALLILVFVFIAFRKLR